MFCYVQARQLGNAAVPTLSPSSLTTDAQDHAGIKLLLLAMSLLSPMNLISSLSVPLFSPIP